MLWSGKCLAIICQVKNFGYDLMMNGFLDQASGHVESRAEWLDEKIKADAYSIEFNDRLDR